MCNEKDIQESFDRLATEVTTDYDVLKAIVVGCQQDHQPSIESARRLLLGLSEAPPTTMAEVLGVLLDGGCFTDEDIEKRDVDLVRRDSPEKVPFTNTGHGHAWPRPDGIKARCGGPLSCQECAEDVDLRSRSATR